MHQATKGARFGALALALALGACGGDDGGDGGSKLSLADAQKTSGVDGSDERADLLFPAACKTLVKCEESASQSACESELDSTWAAGLAMKLDTACRDAALDALACVSQQTCDKPEACDALIDTRNSVCPAGTMDM